ncbi:hypothetical protein SOVF_168100 [Spinacia oleracea]|nr:hypothetical protein SOVF_168100 [Spinacia oleracea]
MYGYLSLLGSYLPINYYRAFLFNQTNCSGLLTLFNNLCLVSSPLALPSLVNLL